MTPAQRAWYEKNRERVAARKKAWREANPERDRAAAREWRRANPDKARAKDRRDKLGQYGLTAADFAARFESQGGCCAICGEVLSADPCIDHDHNTGKVRGLLCRSCNSGIGLLKESPDVLRAAIDYVKRGGFRG